jgi:hypothetical protein
MSREVVSDDDVYEADMGLLELAFRARHRQDTKKETLYSSRLSVTFVPEAANRALRWKKQGSSFWADKGRSPEAEAAGPTNHIFVHLRTRPSGS